MKIITLVTAFVFILFSNISVAGAMSVSQEEFDLMIQSGSEKIKFLDKEICRNIGVDRTECSSSKVPYYLPRHRVVIDVYNSLVNDDSVDAPLKPAKAGIVALQTLISVIQSQQEAILPEKKAGDNFFVAVSSVQVGYNHDSHSDWHASDYLPEHPISTSMYWSLIEGGVEPMEATATVLQEMVYILETQLEEYEQ
ncbi:hypothetical protein OAD26_00650 [bacterium]|nr:hypothetical protein [bacterium]